MTETGEKLLLRVKALILEEPRRLDMSHWGGTGGVSECGTTACIAGWACILSGMTVSDLFTPGAPLPEDLLGITGEQADALFYLSGWPQRFARSYEKSGSDHWRMAQVAARRIDHFLATGL